ncbi:hypothetical protein K491DRAFT_610442 [Lophiostoma macrostomum CBS 122681]|uniref:Secretory phospholipase A2 n=1 Tax=Lophiostoma macrostomum CBS 122681 TaxID=1314788 RepID=A0A6A6SRH9_9PLEO|nr:hypothetical protein K491DRAFT_610442 [Lophiostoma macrostomum CBS 122681]
MPFFLACLLSLLFSAPTCALLIPPQAPANVSAVADLVVKTDTLLFDTALPAFIATRELAIAALGKCRHLDWSSDGCSSSPDNPFHFPFLPACYRHDFGYRNYQNQLRWSEFTREKLDKNLFKDLKDICSGVKEGVAEIYFDAVRAFGGGDGSAQKEALRQQVDEQVERRVKVVSGKLWRLVEGSEED